MARKEIAKEIFKKGTEAVDTVKTKGKEVFDDISETFGEYFDDSGAINFSTIRNKNKENLKNVFKDDIYDETTDTFNFSAITNKERPPMNEGIKQMVESGQIKTADTMSQDQMQLLSLRRDKLDKIREIKTKRVQQGNLQAALDAIDRLSVKNQLAKQNAPRHRKTSTTVSEKPKEELQEIILSDGTNVPVTKLIDPRDGTITSFASNRSTKGKSSLQQLSDNFIQSKSGSGLLTKTNLKTIPAMAEFEVMSHTFRGIAMRDPLAVKKLLAKDPEIIDALVTARNDFSKGMEEILEQKKELMDNPVLNQQLIEIAEKIYPGTSSKFINSARLDLAHIFPFTETARLNQGSSFLTEGGNPKYLYLAPSGVNRKIQIYLESRIREAARKIDKGVKLGDAEQNLLKADELLTKLKSLSIVPIDPKRSIISGDKSLRTDKPVKLSIDDYKELFSYILDMKNIEQEVMSGVVPRLADGGTPEDEIVEQTTILPNITVEFGDSDEKEGAFEKEQDGIVDYIKDAFSRTTDYVKKKADETDEVITDFVDEELGGNPWRAGPVAVSKVLKAPGDFADKIIQMTDDYNQIVENQGAAMTAAGAGSAESADEFLEKHRQSKLATYAQPAVAVGKLFDFMTIPLQQGYENMFTDEDFIYIPGYGKIQADTGFKKALAAGATLGLTALEVLAIANPAKLQLFKNLSPDKVTRVLQHGANFITPLATFITAYEVKDPLFAGPDGLISWFSHNDDAEEEVNKAIEIEVQKGQEINPIGNQINYADGGYIDELALGGEPGQFTDSMITGLEEDVDIQDFNTGPEYESIEDLDELFNITRKAQESFDDRSVDWLDDYSVQMAGGRGEGVKYILGEIPEWVRKGKERVQKILPKTGDELENSLITQMELDELNEGLTPITKSEPGQIFYQRLEAEIMQGPKEYKDLEAFRKYYQSRQIPKIEVIDSELENVIQAATEKGQPITRELVLGALRESPVRYVQSKGYGAFSKLLDGEQRDLKYSGYKEDGAIPNTDRERVLFIDPKDLRGDPGKVPSSVSLHNWEEPYTIAWSRLSDRDLGGKYTGKTVTFADEIQSDIFQKAQGTAQKLAFKIKHMADNRVPIKSIENELQRDLLTHFADKKSVYRESLPGIGALQTELKALMALQDQLTALKNTPVPEITDDMISAAKRIQGEQSKIIDNMTEELNLQLVKLLFPNLPFKLRGQWADASIKRDIYEAAYRKFVLKDPAATDFYAVTPANLVTKRYQHVGSSATSQADRAADKAKRLRAWENNGYEGDIPESQYKGIGMYEFYGGPGDDVVTDIIDKFGKPKHHTSEIEKILKKIARENNVPLEVLPVRISSGKREVWNIIDKQTGEILGSGNTSRQADAIANDLLDQGRKVNVERAEEFDTAPSFGIELTPSMAEAFKAYMAKGGLVEEEILLPYGD